MRNRNHNGRIATVLVAALAALVGTLCLVGTASAQTIYTWKYDGTFPAGSTTLADALPPSGAGPERPRNVHFDQASNLLYASSYGFPENFGEPPPNRLFKMNAAMKSVPWSAFEPNTWLQIPELNGTYAVDNSGTASQGRIYYVDTLGSPRQLRALQPSGLPFTEGFPYVPADQDICGVAVDPEGDVWMSHFNNGVAFEGRPNGFIEEIGADGVPTGEIIYTYANTRGSGSEMCDLVIDADGEIYISGVWASIKETPTSTAGSTNTPPTARNTKARSTPRTASTATTKRGRWRSTARPGNSSSPTATTCGSTTPRAASRAPSAPRKARSRACPAPTG